MTIENGAEQAANDTLLQDDLDEPVAETLQEIEVEYEGKTYCVPAELKDALLRQADYTRKTQEVAQARKALEAERHEHHQGAALTKAHLMDAAWVVALNDQLAHFEKIDWRTLENEDPARAKALWRSREEIRDLRDRAARAWTRKEQEHASHSQRATAKRLSEVSAHLPQLIAEWTPELDVKLAQFGTAHGLTREEMAQATEAILGNATRTGLVYGSGLLAGAIPLVGPVAGPSASYLMDRSLPSGADMGHSMIQKLSDPYWANALLSFP